MGVKPGEGDLATLLAEAALREEPVELEAGDFRLTAPLTLMGPLALKGAGMFQTRLVGSLVLSQGGSLEQLSFEHAGPEPGSAAVCQGGKLSATHCRFRGAVSGDDRRHAGLALTGTAEATLLECHFEHNLGVGLQVRGQARCEATKCRFHDNRNYGAELSERCSGRLQDCEASENGTGIGLSGEAAVELRKNYCHGHRSGMGISCGSSGAVSIVRNECNENVSGIELKDRTSALVDGNACADNAITGVTCFDDCAPTVRNNTCRSNGQGGIQAWERSTPRIENNFAWGNGEAGISFHESAGGVAVANSAIKNRVGISVNDQSRPDVTRNRMENNGCGMAYYDQATGTASGNHLGENEGIGIQVGDGAAPLLLENQSHSNGAYGIAFMQGARGAARDNHCWRNQASDRVVVLNDANPVLKGNSTHQPGSGLLERVKGLFKKGPATEELVTGPIEDDREEVHDLSDLPRYLQGLIVMTVPQNLMEETRRAGYQCQMRPHDPEAFLDYARAMKAMEEASTHPDPEWTQARAQAYELALERGAKDPFDAHMQAGWARAQLGDADCVKHFRAAVELRPDDPRGHFGLVESLRHSGELQEAARVARVAAERCGTDPGVHYQLALALERTGDEAGARAAYAESIRLKPDDFKVQNDFGVLLFMRGEYEPALEHIRTALALNPEDSLAQVNLDRVLARIDELGTAAAHGREVSSSLLFCPTCSVPMDPLLVREVELDRCSACGGLWFDGGELKQVIERLDSPGEVFDPPAQAPELARRPPGQRVCCRCKLKLRTGMFHGIEVDNCQHCGGFFLDQGELAQLWGSRSDLV